jgi:hypothetical protein
VALKLPMQLYFHYPTVAGKTMTTAWLLSGERSGDKRQVVIHMVHSKLQFLSEVSLAYVNFVTTVLIVLLSEHLWMALIRRSVPGLIFM